MANEIIEQEETVDHEQEIDISAGEDVLDSIEAKHDAGEVADDVDDEQSDADDGASQDDADAETEEDEDAEGAEEEGDGEDEEAANEPDDKESKRLKDLQAGFTRASQRNAELRKQLIDRIERDLDGFEELDAEEAKLLKEEDPDAYIDYLEDLDEKRAKLAEKQQLEQEAQQDAAYDLQAKVADAVVELAVSVGIDKKDKEAVVAFFNSPELEEASNILVDPEYGFQRGQDGLFTAKQLKAAYRLATADKEKDRAAAEAQTNGYKNAVDSINKAARNGSKLSQVQPKGPKHTTPKKRTQEEILAMGEEAVDLELSKIDNNESS